MGSFFLPQFEGRLSEPLPKDVLERVAQAIRVGTFQYGPSARAQYVLVSEEPGRVRFRARTWLTAIGIGLNDVTLERLADGGIAYFVSFYRWFYYCFFITLVGMAVPAGMLVGRLLGPSLGFTPAFGGGGPWVTFGLGAALVAGVFWPFVLTALHKPMAGGFLEQLVRHACAGAANASARGGAADLRGGYEYVAGFTVWGLPLVHVALGARHGGTRGVAKGIIAIGDVAFGLLFAAGGVAVGGIAMGGVSLGLLTVGGVALGGAAAGGLAVGLVAFGGLAVGGLAIGGVAVGYHALGGAAVGMHAFGGGTLAPH